MGLHETHVRSSLRRFTRTDQEARLKKAESLANKEAWFSAFKHSEKFEREYWQSDNIHEGVDPAIINIASDDESEDQDDVFLNSACE